MSAVTTVVASTVTVPVLSCTALASETVVSLTLNSPSASVTVKLLPPAKLLLPNVKPTKSLLNVVCTPSTVTARVVKSTPSVAPSAVTL